ncbi:MAG: LPXTG cell wall anchor domain-containing protein [Actinomycetota bacterium]|nr:LPXTG cell wall anchor domain-containing protein [Actinomycetota bacterium]
MIGFVGTAAAHTNRSHAKCEGDTTTLTVDLTAYNPGKTNTVKITDGDKVLDENTDFGDKYQEVFEVPGDVKHVFTIEVKAGDDVKGHEGWSFTKEYTVEACVEQTTPPTETTTTTTTTEQEEVLAETGASVALPLGIAGVLIVGGVGAMFFVRRRKA